MLGRGRDNQSISGFPVVTKQILAMLNSGYPHYPGEISRRSANGVCSGGKMRKGPPFFVDSTLHHLVFRSREESLSQTKMAFILDLQRRLVKSSQFQSRGSWMGCRHLTDLISFSSVEAIDQTIAPLNKSGRRKDKSPIH